MYQGLIESVLVITLAGLGLADAWRLSDSIRLGSAFHDVIGPDRYLIIVSVGLLVCGVWNLVASLKEMRHAAVRETAGKEHKLNLVLLVAFVLILYTAAMPFLGYLLATLVFFPVVYFIFGVRPLTKSVVVGVITTVLFYAIFAHFAELPLPKGLLENIL